MPLASCLLSSESLTTPWCGPDRYNTQALSTAARPITPEDVLVIFDKKKVYATNKPPTGTGPGGGSIGEVTAIALPITVVAVNQPAVITSRHQVRAHPMPAVQRDQETRPGGLDEIRPSGGFGELALAPASQATCVDTMVCIISL